MNNCIFLETTRFVEVQFKGQKRYPISHEGFSWNLVLPNLYEMCFKVLIIWDNLCVIQKLKVFFPRFSLIFLMLE